jgi:hypothetical protein
MESNLDPVAVVVAAVAVPPTYQPYKLKKANNFESDTTKYQTE